MWRTRWIVHQQTSSYHGLFPAGTWTLGHWKEKSSFSKKEKINRAVQEQSNYGRRPTKKFEDESGEKTKQTNKQTKKFEDESGTNNKQTLLWNYCQQKLDFWPQRGGHHIGGGHTHWVWPPNNSLRGPLPTIRFASGHFGVDFCHSWPRQTISDLL